MPSINRVSTIADQANALSLTINGREISLAKSDIHSPLNTPGKRRQKLEELFGAPLPNVHIHRNRNGSIAVATGAEPSVWPEDETS